MQLVARYQPRCRINLALPGVARGEGCSEMMEKHAMGIDQLHAAARRSASTRRLFWNLQMQIDVSCWLQEAGYSILACFGDQWSDLSGPYAGLASFILPNPFYYLL